MVKDGRKGGSEVGGLVGGGFEGGGGFDGVVNMCLNGGVVLSEMDGMCGGELNRLWRRKRRVGGSGGGGGRGCELFVGKIWF